MADGKAGLKPGLFYKHVFDNLYDGVYFCAADMTITYWNRAAEILTGYTKADVLGKKCMNNILMHANSKGELLCGGDKCPTKISMNEDKVVEEEIYIKHKQGYRIPVLTRIHPIKNSKCEVIGAVEIFSNSSAKLSAFNKIKKLEELAFIDPLTGVGNRRYAEIKIGAKIEELARYAWAGAFGLMFLDIDHFKAINDSAGHHAGDEVLKVVSKTILMNLREEDFVGRWGGEEFVVLIAHTDKKKLYSVAEKLRSLVEGSAALVDGARINVTISVGVTMVKNGDTVQSAVNRADRLMYECKAGGRNCVTIG